MSNVKIVALGGVREFGKNMYVVEVDDVIFILDAGLKYPETEMLGVDFVIPDMSYLVENADRVAGVFLTHGHPDAYLAAGCFAAIISNLMSGNNLETAINVSKTILKQHDSHEYVLENIDKALKLSKEDNNPVETIEKQFGKGANAAETLGIALYSVLKHPDSYKKAVITAVNHSGDSDTTGAVAGNISGLINGPYSVPSAWHRNIEHIDWINKYTKTINMLLKKPNPSALYEKSNILERWSDDKFI